LLNLIGNSFDAVQELPEKWIKVNICDLGKEVEISVTDSGLGIPEAIREKITQPFFTTKEIGKGTGLGLSISRGIVESHNGRLFVDATCANTRIVVVLPKLQDAKTGRRAA
jgi:signal transduction histidine kinase